MSHAKRLGNRDKQLNFYPKKPWPECVPEKAEGLKVIRFNIPTPSVFRLASSLAADWTAQEKAHLEVVAEFLAVAWQVAAAAALKPQDASAAAMDPLRGHLSQAKAVILNVQKNKPELAPLVNKAIQRVDDVMKQVNAKLGWGAAASGSAPTVNAANMGRKAPETPLKEDSNSPWWKKVFSK